MKVEKAEKQDRETVARGRGSIYGLLAAVFRQEPSSELIQKLKDSELSDALSDLGVRFDNDFLNRPNEELVEILAVEYARLFLGPGKHISPHESVHHQREDGDWGKLWGASTVEMKRFIEAMGLNYKDSYTGMPDHISVELEFMQELIRGEEQAWADADEEEAYRHLDVERRILVEHLMCWVPAFCDKVIEGAELPFYRDLAVLTKQFIEFEEEEFKKMN